METLEPDETTAPTTSPDEPTHEATTPPGNADVDDDALREAEEGLDQAGGGH